MTKKLLLSIVIVVVFSGIAVYYLLTRQVPLIPPELPTQSSPAPSTSTTIRTPVDIFGNETNVFAAPFVNTSTGVTISFKNIPIQQRGSKADVYVNQERVESVYLKGTKLIGERGVGGRGSMFRFSPNNKYFAFRSHSSLGAGHEYFTIDVISPADKKVILVLPPRREQDYLGPKSPRQSISPTIDSYTWGDDAVNITFYFVTGAYDSANHKIIYYRVSPKEIWRYDLTSGKYTLIQTLPE